jgi:hypothetical protein
MKEDMMGLLVILVMVFLVPSILAYIWKWL